MPIAPRLTGARSRTAVWIVLGGALVRLVVAALLPVFPDEAYYWDWSRHPAAGYFDHPPGISLLIRAGGALLVPFGAAATPIGVRLGPVLAGLAAGLATIAVARRIAGEAAAVRAALVITALPLAAAGLVLATPDVAVIAMTALGCYTLARVIECQPRTRESLGWWLATGVVLGLAFASKYTSILLPAGLVAAFVLRPGLRARFREPGPYLAAIVATLVFLPVLIWNAHHDWISFTYQLRHGLVSSAGPTVMEMVRREGEYVGGQAGLASPILFVLMAIAVASGLRRPSSDARFALASIATLTFALFAYSALRRRVEPNWPSPGYVPAILLLATLPLTGRATRWFAWSVGLAAALSAVIYVQAIVPILPIAPRRDPVARAFGWRDLTDRAVAAGRVATAESGGRSWAGGDRYQEAAEIAFHDDAHPPTFAVNLSGRANQYDLWPRFPARAIPGDNLVLVLDETDQIHPAAAALAPFFREVRRGDRVVMHRGAGETGVRRIWLLLAWRGGWPIPAASGAGPIALFPEDAAAPAAHRR